MPARSVRFHAALLATLLIPLAASADPTPESQMYLKEAFHACQEAISYNKIDADLFQKWMENRAKAVRADSSIRTWTGKLDGEQVNTRFEKCEALFKKALDDAEKADAEAKAKAAAAKQDPAVVGPFAERALGSCFETEKATGADGHTRWIYEQESFADRRKQLLKDYPDAEKLKTPKAYGPTPAGATWHDVFAACTAYLDKGLTKAKAEEAKRQAAEKEAQKQANAEAAANERKWLAKLKGDRLKIYKRRNNTMPSEGDETSATWVYHFTGGCVATYMFRGNTMSGVTKEGAGCSQIPL